MLILDVALLIFAMLMTYSTVHMAKTYVEGVDTDLVYFSKATMDLYHKAHTELGSYIYDHPRIQGCELVYGIIAYMKCIEQQIVLNHLPANVTTRELALKGWQSMGRIDQMRARKRYAKLMREYDNYTNRVSFSDVMDRLAIAHKLPFRANKRKLIILN